MKPRRLRISLWVPVAIAAVLGAALYGLWVRPTQARIAGAEQRLQQTKQQSASLEAQIRRDHAVPFVPLPLTKAAFDRLWPGVITRAQAAGYTLQGATFVAAPPLFPVGGAEVSGPVAPEQGPTAPTTSPGPVGSGEPDATVAPVPVTPIEISARFTGSYLPLDEAVKRMQDVLPLWSWRSIHVSAQQGNADVAITVAGVVPVEGRVAGVASPAVRRPILPTPLPRPRR